MPWWIVPAVIVAIVLLINLKDPILDAMRSKATEPIGTWRYYANTQTRQVRWNLETPLPMTASLAAHVLSWRLFYLQGQPEEPELLEGIKRLLADPDDCDWTRNDVVTTSDDGFGLSGKVVAPGLLSGYPGVIGGNSHNRVPAAVGSALVLLQIALHEGGMTADAARQAAQALLDDYAERGAPKTLAEVEPRAKLALKRSNPG